MEIARLPFELRQIDNIVLVDDFVRGFDTTNAWGTVLSSSVTAVDAAGIVTVTTNAQANDEGYVYSKQALFLPTKNKNFYGEAYIQYTEQNTSMANVAFGIMSGVATGAFQSAGAGIRSSGTFIGIYKKSGDITWRCRAQNGSSSVETVSTSTCGLSTYTKLNVEILMEMGNVATIAYRIDGDLLRDTNNQNLPIKHNLDLTNLAAAELACLLRAGSTNTVAEVLNIDYLAGNQNR